MQPEVLKVAWKRFLMCHDYSQLAMSAIIKTAIPAINFSAIVIITNLLSDDASIFRIADTAPPTPIQASVRYKLICQ